MRGVCQPTWEFKSPLSHQKNSLSVRMGCFFFYQKGDLNSRGLLETCRRHVSTRGGPAPQRGFKSPLSRHKRNGFCLPRQKAFLLAFYGKMQAKSHKMRQNGLRDGHHGCPGACFFVSGTENRPKMLVYFLRFFALQRSRQSTARGDLNTINFAYAL